ncbi:MAG: hypothetical protein EXR08_04230 [Alphaproteobacteria bacterium]|nr:hypothetical protein [Alphaproteobacteria bacterium]
MSAAQHADLNGSESETDALDILPLANMPLETTRLLRAKLIKNIKLDSVIEMFASDSGASGQVDATQIHTYFRWKEGYKHPDQKLLTALSKLPSYDVFSTRIALRHLGIELENLGALQLSNQRKAQLNKHMQPFIAPLLRQILDPADGHVEDFDQLAASMRRPDKTGTMANLVKMSEKLQINVQDLPQMLEDYADIFLSVAYYQEILDNYLPRITEFLDQLKQLQQMPDLRRDTAFSKESEALEGSLNFIVASVSLRFEAFYRITEKMWGEISGESFDKLRKLVISSQTLVGGVLCGLTVKIRGWEDAFGGQPLDQNLRKRVQFVQNEMHAGIEKIEALETLAKRARI